ncbi:MAG: hypothetical protein WBM90_14610, partial [Acidimicrobiia bacterium]
MIAGPVSAKKRRVLILRSAAAFGAVLSIAASFLLISDRGLWLWISGFDGFVVLFSIGFAVFTWLVATRQPDNGVVWAMAAAAFFGGLLEFGLVAVFTFFDVPEPLNDIWVPALAPSGAAWIYFSTGWAWVPALIPILTFGVLLFPDGRLPSPKWRPVGMFTAIGLVALTIATIWTYWPDQTAPVEEGPFFNVAFGMVLVAAVLSLAALVGRFRRSTGEQRHQIKWILWGALALVPMFLGVGFVIGGTESEHLLLVPVYAAEVIFLTSYGIAIAKYRLYDIDVVISRSFVLAVLAVFITGTYAAIVVGLGGLIGGDGDGLLLPIAATAVVALAFEPVRFRAQRWANRVVYGKRATPYEVLADLTERLAVATAGEGLLQRLADLLREGVGADYAAVWLGHSGEMIVAATSPEISRTALQPALDGETSFPVSHNGEVVGALEVTKPKGTVLSVQERSLISDLAGSAGAVLGYQRLN